MSLLVGVRGFPCAVATWLTVTDSPAQVRTAAILRALAKGAGSALQVRQIDAASLISVLRARDFDLCMSPRPNRPDPDGDTWSL